MRYALLLLLAATIPIAACGTEGDDRPKTFEVVTLEVLKPTCGQVQCHSRTTWTKNLAFDTLTAAQYSLCTMDVGKGLPASQTDLYDVLHGTNDKERMPPDLPMAREDEDLILNWVDAGAPGMGPCK